MQATFFFSFYYYSGSFLWSATRMITKPFAPRTSRTSCTTWPFLLKEEVLTNPRSKLCEPHCLKISKKVSFNIASEASFVYKRKRPNSVTRQVNFNLTKRQKMGGRCQNSNETFWVFFKQCVTAAPFSKFALCLLSCEGHILKSLEIPK